MRSRRWLFVCVSILRHCSPCSEGSCALCILVSLFGPFHYSWAPGNGKDKASTIRLLAPILTSLFRTVVEMVHQIIRVQPNAHVLVCAPSNSATDTLARRLAKVLKPPQLFRLNDERRTFAEVNEELLQYCCAYHGSAVLDLIEPHQMSRTTNSPFRLGRC